MGLQKRRDPLITESVTLSADTDKYIFVDRDGAVVSAEEDAYGITMESGDEGDIVPVVRLGFCPVIVTTAADNAAEKTPLTVGANGQAVAVPSSGGGGSASIVAVSEEATANDGDQTGAYVDCVSPNRTVTWTP